MARLGNLIFFIFMVKIINNAKVASNEERRSPVINIEKYRNKINIYLNFINKK